MAKNDKPLSEGKLSALQLLKQAHEDAEESHSDLEQFAVRMPELRAAGATESDLRWLLKHRYAVHLSEIAPSTSGRRRFREGAGLGLSDNSCFALTHGGEVYISTHRLEAFKKRESAPAGEATRPAADRIRWDGQRHELWVDSKLANDRYKRAARAQWPILDACHAAGWESPVQIILPDDDHRQRGHRLREIVAELNKHLDPSIIRFRMDGSGRAVTFDLP